MKSAHRRWLALLAMLTIMFAFSHGQDFPAGQSAGAPARSEDLRRLQDLNHGINAIQWQLPPQSPILNRAERQIAPAGLASFQDPPLPPRVSHKSTGATSQLIPEAWAKLYFSGNSAGYDVATYIKVDAAGNTYVTGASTSLPYGSDMYTIKYDPSGVMVWGARYDGPAHLDDAPKGISVDGAGNVYVTGMSVGADNVPDYATIKYNAAGVQQWAVRYENGGNDYPLALTVDPTGNVYVTGYSELATQYDIVTIKYNASGAQQWLARYDDGDNDYPCAIALDASGNVYVAGYFWNGTIDIYGVLKYNSSGAQQWVTKNAGTTTQFLYAMTIDPAGNIFVTGNYLQGTSYGILTIKYDPAGVQQWFAKYKPSPSTNYYVKGIGLDASGNIYVGAFSSPANGAYDYVAVKYKPSGVQDVEMSYNGGSLDYLQAMAVDGAGNVYLAGYGYQPSVTYVQYVVVKFNSLGVQQWVGLYRGPATGTGDYALAIAVDGSGNVSATGESYSATSIDFATVRFSPSGARLWASRYDGPGGGPDDYAKAIAADAFGNVYVVGWSYAGSGTVGILPSIVTVKYNSAGVQQWVMSYQGSSGATPTGIGLDAAGNVYVAGSTTNGANSDYVTIKYDPSGVQQWAVRYNNGNSDYSTCMTVDPAGNVWVSGYSALSVYDVATVKYNSSGVQQWVGRYQWGFAAVPQSIVIDGSSNVYLAGYSVTTTASSFLVLKYSAAGVQQWVTQYKANSASSDQGYGIGVDALGNSYVVGLSNASSTNDIVLLKYNAAGAQQWVAKYDNGGAESNPYIGLDNAGNVYVSCNSPDDGISQFATLKYNSSGQQQWLRRYSNGIYDLPQAMTVSPSGNVYVTGAGESSSFKLDCLTIKYDSAGVERWIGKYLAQSQSYGSALAIDKSENVTIAGRSYGTGWTAMLALKYDSTSGSVKVNQKPVIVSRTPSSVSQVGQNKSMTFAVSAKDPDGDPLTFSWSVNGSVVKSGSDTSLTATFPQPLNSAVVVKVVFSDPAGLKDSTTWNFTMTPVLSSRSTIPSEFGLSQNYPNPFNPTTEFELRVAERGLVQVRIFSVLGVEVAMLVNEAREPGVYVARWNAASFPSGIYLCRMKAGPFVQVRKIALLK